MEPDEENDFSVPLVWVGVDEVDVHFSNQFLLQLDSDRQAVFMTVGSVLPPPIIGTKEEILEQSKGIPYLPIKPVARFSMSRERFEEVRTLFNRVAETWPAQPGTAGEERT